MPLALRSLFWIWLILALAAGRLELLARLPTPAIQGLIVALTAALLAAAWLPAGRRWIAGLSNRAIILFHTTRLVGVYFLWLYRQGELPYAFAIPGGIGDILVALLALIVVFAPFSPTLRQRLMAYWNVFGLVDILLVVLTAARLGLADPRQMQALTRLPLSLLPTLLVPLIIASHLTLYFRLQREASVAA